MKKICFVTAIPLTAQAFLRDHISELSKEYSVHLLCDIKTEDELKGLNLTGWHNVRIERGISIWRDIKAVWNTYKIFKNEGFDAVHSVTPKAGLVTALAGKMAGIKYRTHIFTGQVWSTRKGVMRSLLKWIDKIISRCDNHILVDGKSQRAFLVKEGVLREGQAEVFGLGSISGVNSERFRPDLKSRLSIRTELGIADDSICYIFLGRLNHDKGIGELLEAYNRLVSETSDIFLLLVGYDEDDYIKHLEDYSHIKPGVNFHYYGSTPTPEKILNAGDVFVLPTYREGFGTSVLEAASVGLPCISTDAYGVLDAYIEGETGLKCKVGDSVSLYKCMRQMHDNPEMIKQMGEKSRERTLRDFNGKKLSKYWVDFYHRLFNAK